MHVPVSCYEMSAFRIMHINGRSISDGGDNEQ